MKAAMVAWPVQYRSRHISSPESGACPPFAETALIMGRKSGVTLSMTSNVIGSGYSIL